MKTFDEYIIESKQNYIFGGTEDRNTDISDGKLFSELKKGDSFYYWCDYPHTGYSKQGGIKACKVKSTYEYDDELQVECDDHTYGIPKEYVNRSLYYETYYEKDEDYPYAMSTSLNDIMECTNNIFHKDFSDDDIEYMYKN